MSFFKEFKEDFDEAVNDLMPEGTSSEEFADDDEELMVNTFDADDFSAKLDALNEEYGDSDEKSGSLFATAAMDTEDASEDDLTEAAEETLQDEETEVTEEASEDDLAMAEAVINGTDVNDDVTTESEENAEEEIMSDEMNKVEDETQAVTTGEETSTDSSQFYSEPVKFEPKTPVDIEGIFGVPDDVHEDMAVITKGMTITGDLESIGSVDVRGVINGNVRTNGKMVISGKLKGNSTSKEFFADSARVDGEISSEGSVKIGNGSVIVGNISATSAVVAGAVKGDLDVRGPVIIDTTAVIVGNIKSKSVQINNGAVIEGFCSQAYADINVDDVFGKEA